MNTLKATKINLFSFKTPNMKAFHMTWMAFFLCFFGWFGIAPLMAIVRDELHLTKGEIGNIMIASVSITIFARILIGYLCDRIGPRIMYSALLILGAFPVMLIGLSNDYTSFLLFRLAIGVIGASFVVTQFHTSAMFAPNVIGTANAVTAGWGNLGGGITQLVMPLIFAAFVGLGYSASASWRLAMIVPGVGLLIMGVLYFLYTTDTPEGNLADLKKKDPTFTLKKKQSQVSFATILKDYRVWVLAFCYGACFGIEITIDNIAALYFKDKFNLSLEAAGLIAASFGMMNIFARALGGILSDKVSITKGLNGRVLVLGCCILLEGIGILIFSTMDVLIFSVISMISFALFVKMSNGATYAVVPFVNKNAVGSIAGVVGAGGNIGAVMMGFLFKSESLTYNEAFSIIGYCVLGIAALAFTIRFVAGTENADVKSKNATGEFVPAESLA